MIAAYIIVIILLLAILWDDIMRPYIEKRMSRPKSYRIHNGTIKRKKRR